MGKSASLVCYTEKTSTKCDSELGCEDVGRIQSRRPCMGYGSELEEDCVLQLDQERK